MNSPALHFTWSKNPIAEFAHPPTLIDGQFGFTEGPVWAPRLQSWIFSDILRSQMWSWSQKHGLMIYRQPSSKANGNTLDQHGALITCEHATSRVVRESDGEIVSIASAYEGLRLNSPNDVIVDRAGWVLFTDPTYGLTAGFGVARPQELTFQGLFRTRGEDLELIDDDFDSPNGLCLSPLEDVLYVNDSARRIIYRFDYDTGTASNRTIFARVFTTSTAVPDGMKCDRFGNVWCTGAGGVRVFAPGGVEIGSLKYEGDDVANFAFGGEAGDELLLAAGSAVVHAQLRSAIAIERTRISD